MAKCTHERCNYRSDYDTVHRLLLSRRYTQTMTRLAADLCHYTARLST
jgi:hypothetical protein